MEGKVHSEAGDLGLFIPALPLIWPRPCIISFPVWVWASSSVDETDMVTTHALPVAEFELLKGAYVTYMGLPRCFNQISHVVISLILLFPACTSNLLIWDHLYCFLYCSCLQRARNLESSANFIKGYLFTHHLPRETSWAKWNTNGRAHILIALFLFHISLSIWPPIGLALSRTPVVWVTIWMWTWASYLTFT